MLAREHCAQAHTQGIERHYSLPWHAMVRFADTALLSFLFVRDPKFGGSVAILENEHKSAATERRSDSGAREQQANAEFTFGFDFVYLRHHLNWCFLCAYSADCYQVRREGSAVNANANCYIVHSPFRKVCFFKLSSSFFVFLCAIV